MTKTSKLWILITVLVNICLGFGIYACKLSKTSDTAISDDGEYILKYEWPEKPKMGTYTLKANFVDKAGNTVEDVDIIVNYSMPTCGTHSKPKIETMKQNDRGDYLLPMNFVMRGDWEIILSAQKNEQEILKKKIILNI